uniref:probable LRR receptor-like serine/threonine-protein kinase At1g53430 isoform X2 n=1 Tax=Erigeron canadensis TaxID=72917 RepID=UPI001CB98512|nr:probable LRR receptor-like serine/threonine-protein kinase At1g53430 isoform X2 [Erigeron canadensis]
MKIGIDKGEKHSIITSTQPCRRFSIAEIQSATNDFDDELVIGEGGFGKVYKGDIIIEESSHIVAIKRLDSMSNQGASEFRAEIEMLSTLRHCNLVSLIGFCDESKEMILVYEYMPHETLSYHLHKAATPLTWFQRLKIAIGAARGLDYLHTGVGTKHGVIHRDVKSSNILLDENWAAMISDFGLSKLGPIDQSISHLSASIKGTFGYLDPAYSMTGHLTRKTDVYAFGVVLFELYSGRLAVDRRLKEEECSLVRWAQKCVREKKLDQMIDPNMRCFISPKCKREFAQIANRCLHSYPEERPTMAEIVVSLQTSLELQRKFENPVQPLGISVFTWKIHKYLVFTTKQNSESGTSSLNDHGNNMKQNCSTNKDCTDLGYFEEIVAPDLKRFTYVELECTTRDFGNDTCLGEGRCATVYKGWVDKITYAPFIDNTGLPVVVKRLHLFNHLNLEVLRKFSHPNLVKLLGYCLEGSFFLVQEFMHNGNFEGRLLSGVIAQLPLATKVKIAVGIARGIVFLDSMRNEITTYPYQTYRYNQSGIVNELPLHRHKILLAEDFTAKFSDYYYTEVIDDYYYKNPRFRSICQGPLHFDHRSIFLVLQLYSRRFLQVNVSLRNGSSKRSIACCSSMGKCL